MRIYGRRRYSFDAGSEGWFVFPGAGTSQASSADAYDGAASRQITGSMTSGQTLAHYINGVLPIGPGQNVRVRGAIKAVSGTFNWIRVMARCMGPTGVEYKGAIVGQQVSTPTLGDWYLLEGSLAFGQLPAGTETVGIEFWANAGATGTIVFLADMADLAVVTYDQPRRQTPLTIIAGDRVLEESALTVSNADPGGFQVMTVSAPGADLVPPDSPARVLLGTDTAWHGVVNEPGAATRDTRADDQLGAVGYGAKLRDNPFSVVYIDRDFSAWKGASTTQRAFLLGAGYTAVDPQARQDASGIPALATEVTGEWVGSAIADVNAWYDAGPGNRIAALFYAFNAGANVNTADTNWSWQAALTDIDHSSVPGAELTGNLRAASGSGVFTPSRARRYALLFMFYAIAGGEAGKKYGVDWRTLAAVGDHGVPVHGTVADPGVYLHDVWLHALARSGAGILPGRVDNASNFLARHLVYRDAPPEGAERIMLDAAQLLAWHTGVWEPVSVFDDTPRGWLCAPPTEPTCVVYRRECDQFDSPKLRRDLLYTRAEVKHRDSAGTTGVQVVELKNPLLDGDRTLQLDLGIGSAGEAAAYGRFALLLAASSARAGGSCTVGDTVHLPGGGRLPAILLKAGRHRIQIPDLPDSGSMTEMGTRRDTFLIRRVETTVQGGRMSTRIEFDGGADLLEVLNARTAMALAAANL